MRQLLFGLGGSLLLLASCSGGKQATQNQQPLPTADTETRELDTLFVSAPAGETNWDEYTLPIYQASQPLPLDLKHTKLRLRFDWAKEEVIGQATLKFSPTFRPQRYARVDAQNFEFKRVSLGESSSTDLKYTYDKQVITVDLGREFKRGEDFELYFDYIAKPSQTSSGTAITSDKGLFFIDPRNEDPSKPEQIWTQGETEHNSNWMPTLDQPNERATQEFFLTVDKKYKTLSNGIMVSSTENADGTRTDYWRMDLPHAPYLHMIAVGEFAKVDDKWRNIPLSYYVEPEYEPYAKEIFAHTPEMLEFFSNKLGVDYPWQKYSQVIVRDYVSGAMENTTAVIFGEFVQKTDRELMDDHNDLIVAHELFHHWFGDLVTCESWANLTLNEGFANYSEYLWFEHNEGYASAENHRFSELQGYLGSAEGDEFHPLIWYAHPSPEGEDMFDAHSYNKGGLVLHMLRKRYGDDAFFASLKKYLNDNKFSAVEVDELRIAFEDTVGEDLNWFFDQWFLGNGHPQLIVDYSREGGDLLVDVRQVQDPESFRPVFLMPSQIGIYGADGSVRMEEVIVDKRQQQFRFAAPQGAIAVFDPASTLLAELNETGRSMQDQQAIFERVKEPRQQLLSIRALREGAETEGYEVPAALVTAALQSDNVRVRNNGIMMSDLSNAQQVAMIQRMTREDGISNVRANALDRLSELDRPELLALYTEVLDKEKSYLVMASGLQGLFKVNPGAALERAKLLENEKNDNLSTGIAKMYMATGDPQYLGFFERKLDGVDGQAAAEFAGGYLGLAFQSGPEDLKKAIAQLGTRAQDQKTSLWRRYGFTQVLAETRAAMQAQEENPEMKAVADLITEQITQIKAAETNSQLQRIFSNM